MTEVLDVSDEEGKSLVTAPSSTQGKESFIWDKGGSID